MGIAEDILFFTENFSLYFVSVIFVIGGIGNLINICVLTFLKLFQSNQCAFYLVFESVVNTCQLTILFIMYLLPIVNGFDPGNISIGWCKVKAMVPHVFRLLSTSMVCFAALDQFLSTNPLLIIRRMSSLRLAHRLTIIAIIIWSLHSVPYGIFYQIAPPSGCIMNNSRLNFYYLYFYYPFLHGFLPIFASSGYALLAYRNVRRLIRRDMGAERRRLDRQLTAMVFARVICFVLFSAPYTIYRIYALNVSVSRANMYPYAIDRLLYTIMVTLANLNYTMSFYIFFATSSRYRRQVKHFFVKKCWLALKNLCTLEPNRIHPQTSRSIAADSGWE
ncbi:unnamed protein product [Adineta ricciae]|uniref:G-protein coupled receptors family 1 profile domain-containing protein n=1 Tax=Adineta ricciae TaxID=249248 RepID=A0A815M5C9_ADIRI|nr:unnamed protein product [Adineta ricciae]CAF1414705.1 unnamed protein product [Adineta ricciae]